MVVITPGCGAEAEFEIQKNRREHSWKGHRTGPPSTGQQSFLREDAGVTADPLFYKRNLGVRPFLLRINNSLWDLQSWSD